MKHQQAPRASRDEPEWTSDHRRLDERDLALHRAVADKIEADPSLVQVARKNLASWLSKGVWSPYFVEWERILAGPLALLLEILRSTDERAVNLRQSSPFAGILSDQERLAIYNAFAARTYYSRSR